MYLFLFYISKDALFPSSEAILTDVPYFLEKFTQGGHGWYLLLFELGGISFDKNPHWFRCLTETN